MTGSVGHGAAQHVRQTHLQELAVAEQAAAIQLQDEEEECSLNELAQLSLDASKSRCRTPEMEARSSDPEGQASPAESADWDWPSQNSEQEKLDLQVFHMSRWDFWQGRHNIEAIDNKLALKDAGGGAQMWLKLQRDRRVSAGQHVEGNLSTFPLSNIAALPASMQLASATHLACHCTRVALTFENSFVP